MTKLEKSGCIALQYEWKIVANQYEKSHLFLTKKLVYQNDDLFRIGLKIRTSSNQWGSSSPASIFFLSTNLKKMGLKASSVFLTERKSNEKEKIKEMDFVISETEENDEAIQMFTLNEMFYDKTKETSFNFTIYLTGIIDGYLI